MQYQEHLSEDIEALENVGQGELAAELESYALTGRPIPKDLRERLSDWILDPRYCDDSEEDTIEVEEQLCSLSETMKEIPQVLPVIDLTFPLNYRAIPNGTFIDLTL